MSLTHVGFSHMTIRLLINILPSQLFSYVCTIAFAVDAFFKFKNYRERMANQQAATQGGANVEAGAHPAATAAAGGTTY